MTGESVLCRGLAERRAIVTGAGSGIGRACAALLARHGTAVAVADLREDAIDGVVGEITADGGRAIGLTCDVGDEGSVAGAVTKAAAEFGGLDTVVAAAGIARPGRTTDLTLAEWDTIIRVNLTGVFLTLKHTLGRLAAAGGGTVVTIGSVASLVAAGSAASYDAPCPNGHRHSYRFTVYALRTTLPLSNGAPLRAVWTAIAAATIGRGRIVVTANP